MLELTGQKLIQLYINFFAVALIGKSNNVSSDLKHQDQMFDRKDSDRLKLVQFEIDKFESWDLLSPVIFAI